MKKQKKLCVKHLVEMVELYSGNQDSETGEWEKGLYCPLEVTMCVVNDGKFSHHNMKYLYSQVRFFGRSWTKDQCTRCGYIKEEELTGGY